MRVLQFFFYFNIISKWNDSKNTFSVNLSNSQLNKLKSEMKNDTEISLNFSSNVISNSDDETNY